MAQIDEIKEHIGALKSYLNIIIAVLLGVGAGVSKLYLDGVFNILFWIGGFVIFLNVILFVLIARSMHLHIKKLKEL